MGDLSIGENKKLEKNSGRLAGEGQTYINPDDPTKMDKGILVFAKPKVSTVKTLRQQELDTQVKSLAEEFGCSPDEATRLIEKSGFDVAKEVLADIKDTKEIEAKLEATAAKVAKELPQKQKATREALKTLEEIETKKFNEKLAVESKEKMDNFFTEEHIDKALADVAKFNKISAAGSSREDMINFSLKKFNMSEMVIFEATAKGVEPVPIKAKEAVKVVESAIKEYGENIQYIDGQAGFSANDLYELERVNGLSPQQAKAVAKGFSQVALDQAQVNGAFAEIISEENPNIGISSDNQITDGFKIDFKHRVEDFANMMKPAVQEDWSNDAKLLEAYNKELKARGLSTEEIAAENKNVSTTNGSEVAIVADKREAVLEAVKMSQNIFNQTPPSQAVRSRTNYFEGYANQETQINAVINKVEKDRKNLVVMAKANSLSDAYAGEIRKGVAEKIQKAQTYPGEFLKLAKAEEYSLTALANVAAHEKASLVPVGQQNEVYKAEFKAIYDEKVKALKAEKFNKLMELKIQEASGAIVSLGRELKGPAGAEILRNAVADIVTELQSSGTPAVSNDILDKRLSEIKEDKERRLSGALSDKEKGEIIRAILRNDDKTLAKYDYSIDSL